MNDSYRAIYDAVLSRISNGDVGAAVGEAARQAFDISFLTSGVAHEISSAASIVREQMTKPSVLYRPALSPDGDQWCALYGEDLAIGVAGFGPTPAEAMAAFDIAWLREPPPRLISRERASS